jgi:hypothetical protein
MQPFYEYSLEPMNYEAFIMFYTLKLAAYAAFRENLLDWEAMHLWLS